MSDVWVGATAGLIGVVLGSGISLAGNLLQRRWQVRDRQDDIEQTRRDEVRIRMDAKAQDLLGHLAELEAIFARHMVISRTDLWADQQTKKAAVDLLNRIAVDSGFLTQPLRRHVRVVVNLIPDAERLVGERWVDTSAWGVAHVCIRSAKRNLERYIRGEDVPVDLGEPIGTYNEAWNDLQNMIEHQLASDEGRSE